MSENELFGICIAACYVLYPILTIILCWLNVSQGGGFNDFFEDKECLAFGWIIAPITDTLFFSAIVMNLIFLFFLMLVKVFCGVLSWITSNKHDDI